MKKLFSIMMIFTFLLCSCTERSVYVAKVADNKISANEVAFYLQSVKSQMAGTELSTDEDWQTKEIEGKKAIDIAKEKALDTAIYNLLYIEVAKKLDIKLSSEDKDNIKQVKNRFIDQFGGEKEYKAFLEENKITDSFIDMLTESMVYGNKLAEKAYSENPFTDDEINEYFEENKDELTLSYRKAKHILFLTSDALTGEPYSEEKAQEVLSLAESVLKRAKKGEDFDALMNEYSEDPGLATAPDGYVFGDNEMVIEFQDGVDALSFGEIGFVKSDYGYHIIKRLPLEANDVLSYIQNSLITELTLTMVDEWQEEFGIEIEIDNDAMAIIGI